MLGRLCHIISSDTQERIRTGIAHKRNKTIDTLAESLGSRNSCRWSPAVRRSPKGYGFCTPRALTVQGPVIWNQKQRKPVPEDHTSVSKDEESGARGLQRDLQDRLQPAHDEPVSAPVSDSAPHPEAPAG